MFLSQFKESFASLLLCKFLHLDHTIFILLELHLQLLLTCLCARWETQSLQSSYIKYHQNLCKWTLVLKVNALLQPKCISESAGGSKRNKLLPTASALCCVMVLPSARGSSQHTFSRSYRQVSVAVVYYECRVSREIWNNLCACNIRQVAMRKAHNLSILRNAYNHNLFLWKSLSFQPLFIYDTAPSRTGNVWCLWVINKTRTGCTLLVDVTSAAGNLLCWSMPVRGWVSSYFVYSLSFSSCKSPAALQLRLGSELLKY